MRGQRIAIIGAGPTGLGAAWRLQELGHEEWDLYESESYAGGLAASHVDENGFVWDCGGHVVFSHYEYFDKLLDFLLQDKWLHHTREAWVWMRDRFIPYPFQNNIWRLPEEDLIPCLEGLVESNSQNHNERPSDFRQWIQQCFGKGIADVFMLPYNFKVWAYDPSKIGVQWMGERVVTVDLKRIVKNVVLKKDDVSWGPNSKFRFPLHGGNGAIWQALKEKLPKDKMHLGMRISSVDTKNRQLSFENGRQASYDAIINTIPVDRFTAMSDRQDLAALAQGLLHSNTHIVGVGLEGQPPASLATKCWMYFPEPEFPFYRVTVFSNYSPNNVPRPGKQWSLMAEVSQSPEKPVNEETLVQDVIAGFQDAQLMPRDAKIASTYYRRLEYGYPTPSRDRDGILAKLDPELRALGIYSRGRFGAWKYEIANQDHSLMQGVEVVDHILLGSEETTYHFPNVVNAGKGIGRRWRQSSE